MESQNKTYELIHSSYEIVVQVCNPTEIKSTISNYTVYYVRGSDSQGQFQVARRYSDFDHIRTVLQARWPGCFVPPLPRKKMIGNNDLMFVENRKIGLDQFVKQMAKLKHLWYSKQFQLLLRSTGDIQKRIKELFPESFQDIIKKYDQTLKNVAGKDIDTIILASIQQFQKYIKKILPVITNFKQMARSFIDISNNNFDQYGILFNYVFPQYEKHFLSVYVNQLTEGKYVFAEIGDEKLVKLIHQMKQLGQSKKIETIYLNLQLEEREFEAFLQLFKIRESYEQKLKGLNSKQKDLLLQQSKLNAGKQSMFKSIFKSNIQQNKKQVQQNIDSTKQNIKAYAFLCDLISIIMGHFEIPRFKQAKLERFYLTVRQIGQFQLKFNQIKDRIWDHILENHNLMTEVQI